jgi:hypothetical protein
MTKKNPSFLKMKNLLLFLIIPIAISCDKMPKSQPISHPQKREMKSLTMDFKSFCGTWVYSTEADVFTIQIKNEQDSLFLDYVIVQEHGKLLNASQKIGAEQETDYAFKIPISQVKGRAIGGLIKNYWDETEIPFHLNLEAGDSTLHWSLLSEDMVDYLFMNVRLQKIKNKS